MKLAFMLTALWLIGAASKELRTRIKSKSPALKSNNVCELEAFDNNNIRCFCVKDKYKTVASAECWVFGLVPEDMWKMIVESQPYLKEFNLIASIQGQIKYVPSDFLHNLVGLKNFTVSFGTLDHLGVFAFGNSSSLEYLKLAKNQIEHLEPFSISFLPRLVELDLQENRIRTIRKSVFHNVIELKYVRLNNNNITKVEDEAFAALGNVIEMDLSENYMCDINTLTFFGLSKVKVIDLSANRIIGLASSVFSEMWDVEELYLDYNYIEFISNRAFDGLRFLKMLSLANNRLSRIPAGLLTSVFTLFNLDLSNNRLETIVFESIEQFYNNLILNGTMQLKGNKFSCDCRLDWIYSLHRKTSQMHVKNTLEELQCTMYIDKVVVTAEVNENLSCPPAERSNSIDEDYQADVEDEEEETSKKIYLMTVREEDLPCPPEYRPTPITVKQGTPTGTVISTNGNGRTEIYAVYIFVCLFLM